MAAFYRINVSCVLRPLDSFREYLVHTGNNTNTNGDIFDEVKFCPVGETRTWVREFVEVLCGHGIHFHKKGRYSCVFNNKHSGTVLKIGETNGNRGYLAYLKLARQHQDNPFFPKIFYTILFTDGQGEEYFFVKMEKLIEGRNYVKRRLYMPSWWRVSSFINACIRKEGYLLDNFMGQQTPISLMDCIFYMKNAFQHNEFAWDIHEENMMMRADGNLVITDPWA